MVVLTRIASRLREGPWFVAKIHVGIVLAIAGGASAGWFGVAQALGPTDSWSFSGCNVSASSSAFYPLTSQIKTAGSGTCGSLFHVHGYFWGADSQWHYDEVTDYTNTSAQISWTQWTNNVYGYHRYPNIPPTHETWDYD